MNDIGCFTVFCAGRGRCSSFGVGDPLVEIEVKSVLFARRFRACVLGNRELLDAPSENSINMGVNKISTKTVMSLWDFLFLPTLPLLQDGARVGRLNRPVVGEADRLGELFDLRLGRGDRFLHHEPTNPLAARRRGQRSVEAVIITFLRQ